MSRDDYTLDVGAFLDNVDGDIVDAEFDIATGDYADKVMMGDPKAKSPIVLKLTIESPELDRPTIQSYSVGSQDLWEIIDGGKSITNVKNSDKHVFRKTSVAGALVEAMFETIGNGSIEKGQDFFINGRSGIYMNSAKFYEGLSFHWATKELKWEIGGSTVVSHPPLPEKFLGEAKATKGKAASGGEVVEDAELDMVLIENASGKIERELKSFFVQYVTRNPDKKNDAYMKAVVSGKKLKGLEEAGLLTMDPDTKKYI